MNQSRPSPQVHFNLTPILPGAIAFSQPSQVLHPDTKPGAITKVLITRFEFYPCNDINSYEIAKILEMFFSGFQTTIGDMFSGAKTHLDYESFIHTHDLSRHFKVSKGEVEVPPIILVHP